MKKISLAIIAVLATCTLSAQSLEFKVDYHSPMPLNKAVMGVNNEFTHLNYTPNSKVYKDMFRSSGSQSFRYPAGTSSNYINLATGQATVWDGADKNSLKRYGEFTASVKRAHGERGVDYREFIKFAKDVNPTVSYIMNVTSMSKEDNRIVMQAIKDAGVELTNIEMGNEVFFGTYASAFKNVEEYIARTKDYSAMVREIFPNVKIALATAAEYYTKEIFLESAPEKGNRLEKWYRAVINCNYNQAVAIHLYSDMGMNNKTTASEYQTFEESYKYVTSHADQRIDLTLNRMAEDFPGKEVWVTEYHVGGFGGDLRRYRMRYTQIGGLFCANVMFKFFKHPNVTLSSWHAMAQWINVPRGSDPDNLKEVNYSNNYYAFRMFKDPVLNSTQYLPVTITNSKKYKGVGKYTGNYNDTEAGVFYNDTTKRGYLMLFNKFENPYILDKGKLEQMLEGEIQSCKEYAPKKGIKLEDAIGDEKNCTTGNVKANKGVYKLSPYSITVVEFQK